MAPSGEDRTMRWCPLMLVAAGPEAPESGLALLGGAASEGDGEAGSSFTEDGRLHVATSGLCLWDSESPTVAITSAALVAPFLRRSAAKAAELCAVMDPELVATTELFAVFPPAHEPRALEATLLAAVPLPEAEKAAAAMQAALSFPTTPSASSSSRPPWKPPPLGSLGMVLLRLASRPEKGLALLPKEETRLRQGDSVRLLSSPFALLKASLFLGMETTGFIAAAEETGEFALLDARQLPGACGGVLVRETDPKHPVALMAPPLGTAGRRWPFNLLISLQRIISAFACTLSAAYLPQRLRMREALHPSVAPEPFGQAQTLLCPVVVCIDDLKVTAPGLLLSPLFIVVGSKMAHALLESGSHGVPLPGYLLSTDCELLPCRPLHCVGSTMLLAIRGEATRRAIASRLPAESSLLEVQEGSEVLAVDLDADEGPRITRGCLQRWLGARHGVKTGLPAVSAVQSWLVAPAIRFGLPKSGGRANANVLLSARPCRPLGLVLQGLEEQLDDDRVLPLQFRAVSINQLKEFEMRLKTGAAQASVDSWLLHFDRSWREPFEAGPRAFDWQVEARPRPAFSSAL
ncbi:unnamed protein product [Symbiodinium sp. CCMP2592]|nr:unnamed protein product [Symbiodinium sp. CCMP2592]